VRPKRQRRGVDGAPFVGLRSCRHCDEEAPVA
jgi:hypothetical protein